jgi:hypothetical protein
MKSKLHCRSFRDKETERRNCGSPRPHRGELSPRAVAAAQSWGRAQYLYPTQRGRNARDD